MEKLMELRCDHRRGDHIVVRWMELEFVSTDISRKYLKNMTPKKAKSLVFSEAIYPGYYITAYDFKLVYDDTPLKGLRHNRQMPPRLGI